MSNILLKETTYKKLKHDSNIKITGCATIRDNGEGKTINVNNNSGWYIDVYDSLDGSTIIHKVTFNCMMQTSQLFYNNCTFTFADTAGLITFLVPRGLQGTYNEIYWVTNNCTGYDTGTQNYQIIPNASNPNPVYDNVIISCQVADNKIKIIKTGYSNATGTMVETTEYVNHLNVPSSFILQNLYFIEGDKLSYNDYQKRINGIDGYDGNIPIAENTNTWIVWKREINGGYYAKQTTATIADAEVTSLVGFIRIKTGGYLEDYSQFYSMEQFKGPNTKTKRFIVSMSSNNSQTPTVYARYATMYFDAGGRYVCTVNDDTDTVVGLG